MMAQLAKPVVTAQYLPTAPHSLRRGSGSGLPYKARFAPRSPLRLEHPRALGASTTALGGSTTRTGAGVVCLAAVRVESAGCESAASTPTVTTPIKVRLTATRFEKYGASCEGIATSCASLKETFRTSGEFHPVGGRPYSAPLGIRHSRARVWQTHQIPINPAKPGGPIFTPSWGVLFCADGAVHVDQFAQIAVSQTCVGSCSRYSCSHSP